MARQIGVTVSRARDRVRMKGRREVGPFVKMPLDVLNSPEFDRLSAHATKLLMAVLAQYRVGKNRDLCASWSVMRDRGWKSKGTLQRATEELVESGWLIKTRQGGRNRCALFAVSFLAIDASSKADEFAAGTTTPPGTWRADKILTPVEGQVTPGAGQSTGQPPRGEPRLPPTRGSQAEIAARITPVEGTL